MFYNGQELDEFRSDTAVVFDPHKKMLVWDDSSTCCKISEVMEYIPGREYPVVAEKCCFRHGAEIPKSKTNWDVYAERNGIITPVDAALDVFHRRGVACIFCPAINFCRHADHFCSLNFEKWAKSEYVSESEEK